MRIVSVLLLSAVWASAADASVDRSGVESLILALNVRAQRAMLFTQDADGRELVENLLAPTAVLRAIPYPLGEVKLVISHEPMGEAMLVPTAPPAAIAGRPGAARVMVSRNIRFISGDVALVDADVVTAPDIWHAVAMRSGEAAATLTLMVVRTGERWRVAAARSAAY